MSTKAERADRWNMEQRKLLQDRLNATSDDIQDLWLNRYIWRATAKIAEGSEAVVDNPYFMYWLTSQYAQAACVAVRRQAESGDNAKTTNSLVAILEAIIGYGKAYGKVNGTIVDQQRVQEDIDELRSAADLVGRYVDKHLAHLDRNANVGIPSVIDLDAAIDLLGEKLQRYLLLLRNEYLRDVAPGLPFDWTAVFDRPWRITE